MPLSDNATLMTIALDAMGGDDAPGIVLEGAALALERHPDIHFIFYGRREEIEPHLARLPKLRAASKVYHAEDVVAGDDKPSAALRQGRKSSMGHTIKSVRDGYADAAVSAGNTGALMAMSKFLLKTLPGIDRPAIVAIMPTIHRDCVVLDLGANVECDAGNLFQFAVMGDAFAKSVLGLKNPKIGLLNIGSEEMKGNETIKSAAEMLKFSDLPLNFHGNIEGDDISKGIVDVVVTDGFSGNIALKSAEGTAKLCFSFLKDAFHTSLLAKIGYIFSRPALKALSKKLDPRMHNGAMFVGLNGIVVKSHGGTDEIGFANAINVAVELIRHRINEQINEEMKQSEYALFAAREENGAAY